MARRGTVVSPTEPKLLSDIVQASLSHDDEGCVESTSDGH